MPGNQVVIDNVGHVSLYPFATRMNPDPLALTSVGTTVARVLPNNPRRILALLINLSQSLIWLGFDNLVSSTNGIALQPGGGSAVFTLDEDADLCQYEMFVIGQAASLSLKSFEVLAV